MMARWLDPGRLARLRWKQERAFTPIFLHRPLAILLLIPLADVAWITPNLLTTASVILRVAVGALLWPEEWGGLQLGRAGIWAVVVVWHLGVVLDAADGTLARYRGQSSAFGRFYDKVSDRIVTLCLVFALAARLTAETGHARWAFIGMVYVAAMSASSVAKWIELGTASGPEPRKAQDPGEVAAPPRSLLAWTLYLFASMRFAFVVTEMDLSLWGSIALLIGRLDLFFWVLALFGAPWAVVSIGRRALRLLRAESARTGSGGA